jgi:hypothetical protein
MKTAEQQRRLSEAEQIDLVAKEIMLACVELVSGPVRPEFRATFNMGLLKTEAGNARFQACAVLSALEKAGLLKGDGE